MSIPVKRKVLCPQCGKEVEYTAWESINTEIPSAIPDVISGKLFEVTCPQCGKTLFIAYPILVNDMIHHTMVYYTTADKLKEAENAIVGLRAYVNRARVVTDHMALREKVSIFNEGLDDRVVEILKMFIMSQIHDQLSGETIQGVYFIPGEKPCFEIIHNNKSSYAAVTMDAYDMIKKDFISTSENCRDSEIYVDQNWARQRVLEKNQSDDE